MTGGEAEAALRGDASFVIVGAPGTGKTQLLRSLLTERVASGTSGTLMWCADRRLASAARDAVISASGRGVSEPPAMTPHSFAYAVLRRRAALAGEPPPRMVSGPEMQATLAELLAGHADGEGADPGWPEDLVTAVSCEGFRGELRELLGRCAEYQVSPAELADWGRRCGRPEWVAASSVYAEYVATTALKEESAFDQGALLGAAVAAVASSEDDLTGVRELLVDDAQELTSAALALVQRLAASGVRVVMAGDPDVATRGFRGAQAGGWLGPGVWHPDGDAPRVVLGTVWRSRAPIVALTRAITDAVGVQHVAEHRRAEPAEDPAEGTVPAVRTHLASSVRHEIAYVASCLRDAHSRGVPWDAQAVIVRSGAWVADVRAQLLSQGIPVHQAQSQAPLRVEHVADLLRTLTWLAVSPERVDDADVRRLLFSDITDHDPLYTERLVALAGEAAPDASAPLVALVTGAAEIPQEDIAKPLVVLRDAVAAGRDRLAAGAGPDQVLWALWSATPLSERWRRAALAGGRAGDRADRHLDAALALFDAVGRFTVARPGGSLAGFWRHVDAQPVATDTLAGRSAHVPAIHLLTPTAALGTEFDVVALVAVAEGLWPNLTPRDSVLGAGALVDAVTGRSVDGATDWAAARTQTRSDELRMFAVAASRARQELVVTATDDESTQPSEFFALAAEHAPPQPWSARGARRSLSPTHLVAGLRAELVAAALGGSQDGAVPHADGAARHIATLRGLGVRGTDPAAWWAPPQVEEWRRTPDGELTSLSPSGVESVMDCPMRWFLQACKLGSVGQLAADIGTLVHAVAQRHPSGGLEDMLATLDELWPSLGLSESAWDAQEKDRVSDMVRRLAEYLATPGRVFVDSERAVTATIDQARLYGRVDRLERDGDALVIVDFKTGRSIKSKKAAEDDPQLAAYQLAIGADEATAGAELVYLSASTAGGARRTQSALTGDKRAWAVDVVVSAAQIAGGGVFPARVSPDCDRCAFVGACPAHAVPVGGAGADA